MCDETKHYLESIMDYMNPDYVKLEGKDMVSGEADDFLFARPNTKTFEILGIEHLVENGHHIIKVTIRHWCLVKKGKKRYSDIYYTYDVEKNEMTYKARTEDPCPLYRSQSFYELRDGKEIELGNYVPRKATIPWQDLDVKLPEKPMYKDIFLGFSQLIYVTGDVYGRGMADWCLSYYPNA